MSETKTKGKTPPDWRDVSLIGYVGIPEGVADLLWVGARILTLGDLEIWQADKTLTDIPGIGQVKAKTIEKALERFWEEHPEYTVVSGENGGGSNATVLQ